MNTTSRASGRCLCGGVSFQVFGDLRDVFNCHCHRCRRFTGHHMAATAADVPDLKIEDDDGNLRWFYPVPDAGYAFCQKCGSSLFWQSRVTPDRISICAGTLDPPTNLKTVRAWWTGEASDYYARPVLQESATELPSDDSGCQAAHPPASPARTFSTTRHPRPQSANRGEAHSCPQSSRHITFNSWQR
jgi:hypothetical protein